MKLRQLPRWIYLYLTGWKNQLFPDMKVRKWTGMPSAVRPVWSATWYRKKKLSGILQKKFFTTVEAIMEVNQKKPNRYRTGDMILILKEVS